MIFIIVEFYEGIIYPHSRVTKTINYEFDNSKTLVDAAAKHTQFVKSAPPHAAVAVAALVLLGVGAFKFKQRCILQDSLTVAILSLARQRSMLKKFFLKCSSRDNSSALCTPNYMKY
jgi:hypothetical protein